MHPHTLRSSTSARLDLSESASLKVKATLTLFELIFSTFSCLLSNTLSHQTRETVAMILLFY